MFLGQLITYKIIAMKTIKYILLSAVLVSFTACNDPEDFVDAPEEVITPDLTSGNADLSNYVAIGASFTAGFTDNALFMASQENSFPNIMSQMFAQANGGAFNQPWTNDNIGGLLLGGNPIAAPRLYFDGNGPALLPAAPTTEVSNILSGPFNNMGVPGAKSFHIVANGYGNIAGIGSFANPYFVRMASNPNASVLEDALAQNPTFFTISEIGGNDVLGYATSGGSGVDQTGNLDPSTYGSNDITDPNVFAQVVSTMVTALSSNGSKGVIATVPSIIYLPHFTTVPHNPVPLDAATANAVNQGYAPYNGGLLQAESFGLISAEERAQRTVNFAEGQNAVVIIDEDLTDLSGLGLPNYRQATVNDLLVLPSSSFIGTLADPNNPLSVNGVAVPLADNWVLTPEEQENIATATQAYNNTIMALANSNENLALLDLDAILIEASTTGIEFDQFIMSTDLVLGGLVSLDGIHLTARGYALMANKFLEAMDTSFGSNFVESGALAKAGDYPTNYSPMLQ